MSYIFSGCNALISLPNLSKFKNPNFLFLSEMFNDCFNCLNDPLK